MSRRCKPGQRARVINGMNRGKIVLVVRYYFGEKLNDANWPEALYPWVVTSLGAPLRSYRINTGIECPPAMTIVVDDCELEPLLDDDDGLDESTRVDKPVTESFTS